MMRRTPQSPAKRTGYVLFIVMIVIVVLTLVAYQYSDAMSSERDAAHRALDVEQARANANSGIGIALAMLADPTASSQNLADSSELFGGQVVGGTSENVDFKIRNPNADRGGGRFSLVRLTGDGSGTYTRTYGISDESAKLNINALIQLDPVGNLLYAVLMKLPNMTEQIADSIVDWVDADSTARPNGAEDDYYMGLGTPYHCKNGPINSIEELLLIQGVTADLLYGSDRNRNGVQDGNETVDASGVFSQGWSEYLTCYGREINVDSTGVPRINLNNTDLEALSSQLSAAVGQELSDYIIYYRVSGKGEAVQTTLPANRVAAPVSTLRDYVQKAIDDKTMPMRKVTSTMTVVGTQIVMPAPPMTPGMPPAPTPVVACPINDATALAAVITTLLDKCTASADYEMVPRFNINTAPKSVLAAIPGLTDADVASLVANQPAPGSADGTAAWVITAAKFDPVKFKNIEQYIGGRSGAYRVHSVGYFGRAGGPVVRVEAVIETLVDASGGTAVGKPRIAYYRDLTDLGRGFDELPR